MHKIFKFVCSVVTFVRKRQTLGWTITKCKCTKVSTNVHYHYDDNDDDESDDYNNGIHASTAAADEDDDGGKDFRGICH